MTKGTGEMQIVENIDAYIKTTETKSSQTTADGLNEVLSWSADLPAWQKDALRRLCAGPDLQANDDKELLEVLKGEKTPEPLSDQHIKKKTSTSSFLVFSLRPFKSLPVALDGLQVRLFKVGGIWLSNCFDSCVKVSFNLSAAFANRARINNGNGV